MSTLPELKTETLKKCNNKVFEKFIKGLSINNTLSKSTKNFKQPIKHIPSVQRIFGKERSKKKTMYSLSILKIYIYSQLIY